MLAIYDMSYQHYALGDAATCMTKAACAADGDAIDLVVYVDPNKPASFIQGHINKDNWRERLERLQPVFNCCHGLRNLYFAYDKSQVDRLIKESNGNVWPLLSDRGKVQFPKDHVDINDFYFKHGRIPLLDLPKTHLGLDRPFVMIHVRSAMRGDNQIGSPKREALLSVWQEVILKRPDVFFVAVGGEWKDGWFTEKPVNLLLTRANGFTLTHELDFMRQAQMFIGNQSGYSAVATFTDVPYLVFNSDRDFAKHAGVAVDCSKYPFASDNQRLIWRHETVEDILAAL